MIFNIPFQNVNFIKNKSWTLNYTTKHFFTSSKTWKDVSVDCFYSQNESFLQLEGFIGGS